MRLKLKQKNKGGASVKALFFTAQSSAKVIKSDRDIIEQLKGCEVVIMEEWWAVLKMNVVFIYATDEKNHIAILECLNRMLPDLKPHAVSKAKITAHGVWVISVHTEYKEVEPGINKCISQVVNYDDLNRG